MESTAGSCEGSRLLQETAAPPYSLSEAMSYPPVAGELHLSLPSAPSGWTPCRVQNTRPSGAPGPACANGTLWMQVGQMFLPPPILTTPSVTCHCVTLPEGTCHLFTPPLSANLLPSLFKSPTGSLWVAWLVTFRRLQGHSLLFIQGMRVIRSSTLNLLAVPEGQRLGTRSCGAVNILREGGVFHVGGLTMVEPLSSCQPSPPFGITHASDLSRTTA